MTMKTEELKKPAAARSAAEEEEDWFAAYGAQGAVGFALGGLIAILAMMGSAFEALSFLEGWGRYAGYAVGGAIGGWSLAWGFPQAHAARNTSLGFAVGFLIPAWLSAPAIENLLKIDPAKYGSGTFIATMLAFGVGYGLAGAIGGLFLIPRYFFLGAVRFGLAGLVGGAVAALGAGFSTAPDEATARSVLTMTSIVLVGYSIPFGLGGYLTGKALEAEERRMRGKRA